jgi:hypothetical protein
MTSVLAELFSGVDFEHRTSAGSRAAEKRHVLPPGAGRHAELGLAEKTICMGPDRGAFEHEGGL